MRVELEGFVLELALSAWRDGRWLSVPVARHFGEIPGVRVKLELHPSRANEIPYQVAFESQFATRIRVTARLPGADNLFHLIPGNIFGDNNAAHVRPGEFPCLTTERRDQQNRAPLWEFRADRASHPVSILCCSRGAAGVAIDPYSDCDEAGEKFIRNGVFASLPDSFGVALGYGNDPLTFIEKTSFGPATMDISHGAEARGSIFAFAGPGRRAAHQIIRTIYDRMRDKPKHHKSYEQALRAFADAFAEVNYSHELGQYTNRKCQVPADTALRPWRAVVEIGWTGGAMLAYPFSLAERIFNELKLPKTSAQIFDELCTGFNDASGFLNDTTLNRFTKNLPGGWNASDINGWWSGFLAQTLNNHCAYTNAHAAYYLLKAGGSEKWISTALRVLDTAIGLQRADGAFGYLFSATRKDVIDFDGFAGCWFAPVALLAFKATGDVRYRAAAERAIDYYASFVRDLSCWGAPMDTYKSVDSEGNLAFMRATRLMHELTGNDAYLEMLRDSAHYEYLWRYCFRTRPQYPPLKDSPWNSCGGSITSVSNPHIHPMSVVATGDLEYLARVTGNGYHQSRADDGIAWLMNTMELYPYVMGYGRYGVLSERTCPSDGLLVERYHDGTNSPASTWWSYNAWAAGSAMEALAEKILAEASRPTGVRVLPSPGTPGEG